MSIPLRALSRDIEIVNEWEKALTGRETSSTSRIPVRPPARERKEASTMNWVMMT